MATLVLLRNPLTPHDRQMIPLAAGTPVIDWLQQEHPRGFGMPIRFYVNGSEKELDELDYQVEEDDVAVIALMPAEPVSLTTLAIGFLISAALSAITYFAMQAFMPKTDAKGGAQDSTYNVSSEQNAAKLGAPVPVVYGEVLTTPDYVAQPYTWFNWTPSTYNQLYSGVQYLDLLLCVGQGDIDVIDVMVADTDSANLDTGILSWTSFKPSIHTSQMGVIAAAMGGGFHENVISSPEVSNQEFVETNDSAGFFTTCPPGQKGSKFQIDIIFPVGQTNPDSSGDIRGRATQFNVYYVEVDDNDNVVGSISSVLITASTLESATVSGPNVTNVTNTSVSDKNRTIIASPLRRSYMFTAPRSARWAVKITRVSAAPNAQNGGDRFIWAGLKLYADYQAGTVYGNVTLLACRIKASQGLGTDAAVRVKVRARRRLAPPSGGTAVQSTSAADAFADIYTDTVYGADRPRSELDTVLLTTLRSKWSAYQFNYVFQDRITVWEALRTVMTPFAAEPLPSGAIMSVAPDGVKNIRAAMFTDANIVSNSLSVNYSFDEEGAHDGVEIEYVDAKDFRTVYTVWPTTSLQPERYVLPGVTSATHASEFARLTWQRKQLQRKKIVFETELEGLILQMGDRIGVSHTMPKWGYSGLVIARAGLTLTLDQDMDWSGGVKYVTLRKPDGGVTEPIMVTEGAQSNIAILASDPLMTFHFDDDYEYTSFAFGNLDTVVRDFLVTSVRPNGGNTVTVEAVNYDPNVYTGAMSYLVT